MTLRYREFYKMYYDLITSLPHLPHFLQADRLPITPLRLDQRLGRLTPAHAEQLARVRPQIRWRSERPLRDSDQTVVEKYERLKVTPLEKSLRDYVEFRMTQQTLLAALRRKHSRLGLPDDSNDWGVGPSVHIIRRNWDSNDFGLGFVHRWLPEASQHLASGDAINLERLLVDLNWRWLTRRAEQSIFGFEAVMAFVFKWDLLQAWLACDRVQAKNRFTEMIDKVTYVANA